MRSASRSSVRASRASVLARLRREPAGGHSGRRELRDRLACRRVLSARADDCPLDLERLRRLDQLTRDRADERVRDCGLASRPHAPKPLHRRPDERIARMPAMELRGVVVERQHESRLRDRAVTRRANDDSAIRQLMRRRPASSGHACRPRRAACSEPEGVRASGPEHGVDHRASLVSSKTGIRERGFRSREDP